MLLRKTLLASVSVIGFAIAAPAMAQTVLNPQQATGTLDQSGTQTITTTATGLNALAAGNQFNSNGINLLGNGTTALSVSSNFTFGQVIGSIDPVATPSTTTLTQSALNTISATGSTANGTAALIGGGQSALNSANSATFALLADATGTLQQAINTDLTAASSFTATNTIGADGPSGQASILGNGFGQVANTSLNSAAFLGAGAATIGLDQKAPTGTVNATQTNIAAASVANAGNPVIDPSITNLSQTAGFSLNTVAGQGATTLTLTNGGSDVGQNASFATGSTIESANSQTALTGAAATPSNGLVQISGASQSNGLTLNTVSNTGATTFGDLAAGFTQAVDLSNVTLSAPIGVTYGAGTNTVATASSANLLVASTGAGNASVAGSSSALTQANSVNLNNVSSGGLVSGTLAQSTTGAVAPASLANTALALTGVGSATLTNVSQSQGQSLNTLSGAGAASLDAQQTADSVTLGANNVQTAQTALGVATIGGGLQGASSSVNVATLGSFGAGSLLQTANAVSQTNGNSLTANGGAAIAGGSQSVTNTINQIK